MRISEAINVKASDFNLKEGTVILSALPEMVL